jgi:two-component system NtrC family response regulator
VIAEKPRTLLIVEDDPALQKQLRWSFDQFETLTAGDRESALTQVHRHNPAVVTMDLGLPPDADSVSEGFRLLEQILAVAPDTKVIVLTGQNDRTNALRAIGLGAYDFFAKPFEPELLALTIDRAFRLYDLQQENRRLQAAQHPPALAGLLTRNAEMLRVCRTIEKVANSSATVLLLVKAEPAKKSWRVASTKPLPEKPSVSSPSTVPPSLTICSKVSFSATKKALLRALPKRHPAK